MTELRNKVLLRRYKVLDLIDRGGVAEVYRAHDHKMGVDVALKFLRDDLVEDPLILRRFRREAGILRLLQHPNVVRLYEFEELELESRLRAFMVLDLIEGTTLRRDLAKGGDRYRGHGKVLSPREVWRYLQPIGAALHYAHTLEYRDGNGNSHRGIVHCDLKPSNVLVDKSGRVYVADFGIAQLAEGAGTTTMLTPTGTLYYMAPEQWEAKKVDVRTDVYALGVMLYEMLTGVRPFTGETDATTDESTASRIRWQHINEPPPPPSKFNRALSPEMERVILRCLEKKPAERFESVAELLAAIESVVGEGAAHSPPASAVIEQAAAPQKNVDAVPAPSLPFGLTKKGLALLGGAVLVCGVMSFLLLIGGVPYMVNRAQARNATATQVAIELTQVQANGTAAHSKLEYDLAIQTVEAATQQWRTTQTVAASATLAASSSSTPALKGTATTGGASGKGTIIFKECRGHEGTLTFAQAPPQSIHAWSTVSFTIPAGSYPLRIDWLDHGEINVNTTVQVRGGTQVVPFGDQCR